MDDDNIEIWKEDLPENCPPEDAKEPGNEIYYRLVTKNLPIEEDFFSNRKLFPNRKFNTDECIARAVSIITCIDACKQLCKLPAHKDKLIAKLILSKDAGLIKKTGRGKHHHSWWIKKDFNPIKVSEIVNEKN